MGNAQTKAILFFVFQITIISFYSCSSNKHIIKTTNRLHDIMLGKWSIERRSDSIETDLSRLLGLTPGTIVFYPTGDFMYKNKTERQTGDWYIDASLAREHEYWLQELYVPEQSYPVYKISLFF